MLPNVFFLHLLIPFIFASTVKWLPNSSFKIPVNFKDGKLPCSKQTVVFPERIIGSIKIETSDVNGFILPEDGELILDGTVYLGQNPQETNCTEGYSYYVDKMESSWNQADVWSSPKFNDATPDSYKIPCFNDQVEFPEDVEITVHLPEQIQHIKSITIGNDTYIDSMAFLFAIRMSTDDSKKFTLNRFWATGLSINVKMQCTQFGCPCQIVPLEIDCSVKFCPKPTCMYPIKPLGFCCEICGGSIVFEMNKDFDIATFQGLIEDVVNSYGRDTVVYHVDFVLEIPVEKVQLVVVDKGSYEGTSAEVVNSVNYAIHEGWYKSEKVAQISGSPLYKSGMSGKIFVSVFFIVILVMGAIYVYYYKLPGLRYRISTGMEVRDVFSRFQRRTDSVVSLTGNSGIRGSIRSATAFRNPMYDSIRGRVHVTEPVTEE